MSFNPKEPMLDSFWQPFFQLNAHLNWVYKPVKSGKKGSENSHIHQRSIVSDSI